MALRIGTRLFGQVEKVRDQSIQTKFFVFGGPLIPLGSYYCIETNEGIRAIPIVLNKKSVFTGYMRTWFGVVGGVMTLIAFTQTYYEWLIVGIPLIGLALLSFKVGDLTKEEKARREVLLGVLGIAAPPNLLPAELVSSLRMKLEILWLTTTPGAAAEDWKREVAAFTEKDKLPLLYCLAVYGGDQAMTEKVWKRLTPTSHSS